MSAISNTSSTAQGLAAFFSRISQAQSPSSTSSTAAVQAGSDPDGDGGKVHSGHHHGGHGALFKQIQSAVSSALQSTDQSGSSTDVNQAIQNAIEGVLKGNGGATAGDPTASTAPSASQPADVQSSNAFSQLLQSHGIDLQQFRADFQAALQSVQGSSSSLATGTLPPGTFVDETA